MATHDYVIDNSTGANVRADINSVLQAILSNNSNSSAPSTTAAYMFWADTTNGVLKIRNAANNAWVELLQLDGTLTLENGAVGTPALAFRDDLDTGIFRSGDNKLAISCNGTEVIEFGISEAVFNDTGADINFRIEGDADANLFFVDAGNDRIGIKTSSPTATFTVLGTVDLSGNVNIGSNRSSNPFSKLTFGASQYGSAEIRPTNDTSHKVGLSFYTDGTADTTINPTERMRIDSSGNVGIGTTSPVRHLHLNSSTSDTVQLHITNSTTGTTGSDGVSFALGSDESLIINQRESNHIALKTADTERMRIDSSGDILIGKTSDDFDTAGTHIDGGDTFNLVKSGTGVQIKLNRSTNVGTFIEFRRGSANIVGSISSNNTTTSYNTSSDYRLKENVTAISDGITRLKTLKPSRFNFKAEKDTTVDGFLAHEVTAVPEAISGTKDEVDENNNPVYQGIDQSKLVPLLTAALQEAITKIEVLETKVAALEAA